MGFTKAQQHLKERRKTLDYNDLGQFLSSEVESDGFRIARVVDFDVNLVIILIFPDECSFQAGHLILLPVDQDLWRKGLISGARNFNSNHFVSSALFQFLAVLFLARSIVL